MTNYKWFVGYCSRCCKWMRKEYVIRASQIKPRNSKPRPQKTDPLLCIVCHQLIRMHRRNKTHKERGRCEQ